LTTWIITSSNVTDQIAMKNIVLFLLSFCALAVGPRVSAGSATWSQNPTSNLWNVPENWVPATVPNGQTDVASFGVSSITDILDGGATSLQDAETDLSAMVFGSGASAYTLTMMPGSDTTYSQILAFYGQGIVNDSGKIQNLVTQGAPGPEPRDPGAIAFLASSSAGENLTITNQGSGSSVTAGGYTRFGLQFADTPSAGSATFINEGEKVSGTSYGGGTELLSYSTAESATFINQPCEVAGAAAGRTYLYTGGNIGTSTFINNAATMTGAKGGWTEIDYAICAGNSFIANGATTAGPQGGQVYSYGGTGYASFTAKGGQGNGAEGGLIEIHNITDSSQTVVTAEGGGADGLGGLITLNDFPTSLDQVQFQLLGNGTMDLSGLLQNTVTIGSLSGQGSVLLARFILNIGGNNLSTTFSGVIQDTGGITKTGTGTLTLSGANSYSKGTNVNAGTLLVANQSGSGTGTGPAKVNSGTLGGSGIISGKTTIGTGSGTGAFLAPAAGSQCSGDAHDPKQAYFQRRCHLHLHLQSEAQQGQERQGNCQRRDHQ
jgi:autotransporter-associated beta strand protein